MKLAPVIVCLAAIAVGVVHFRRERTHLRNEVQRMESSQVALRRDLWDQQVRMGWLIAPAEIRRRAQELELPLSDRAHSQAPATPAPGQSPPPRGRSTIHD